MLLSTPLALLAYCLLLGCVLGSLVISWRTLKSNDSLQGKIDWLRRTLGTRDSTIRSYETGHHGEVSDEQRTREMPPPLPRRER